MNETYPVCEACRQSTSGLCAQHATRVYVVPSTWVYPTTWPGQAPVTPFVPEPSAPGPWITTPYVPPATNGSITFKFDQEQVRQGGATVQRACDFLDRVKQLLSTFVDVSDSEVAVIFTKGAAADLPMRLDSALKEIAERTEPFTAGSVPALVDLTHDMVLLAVSLRSRAIQRADAETFVDRVKAVLLEKNHKYGDSATTPIRIFSKASPVEQLLVRLDDKLSRIARGAGLLAKDEDVLMDLVGYLALLAGVIWE